MRNFKFLIVLVIFLAGCICVGSVFATDVNDDISVGDVASTDEVNILHGDTTENNAEIISFQANEGNFTELKQKIYDADVGDIIALDKNYKYLDSDDMCDGVVIDKTLTIEGQGHTIDGSSLARAFNVSADNVIVKNINFIDCAAESGGAIYWFGADGCVSGCSFTDCSALFGGAIDWYNKTNGNVSYCSFTNCNASIGGAIIWFGADGSVNGCNFSDCNAQSGGAIYWAIDNGCVSDCIFNDCSSDNDGGAISCYGADGNVRDCIFTDCAANYGGAINWAGADGSVSGCSFSDCNAQSGGAIYWAVAGDSVSDYGITDSSSAFDGVNGCSFADCSATYGGAIIWFGDDGSVGDCSFTNCNAKRSGGAIDWNDGADGCVSDCSFADCSAIFGGSIDWYNSTDGSVSGCSFTDCSASYGEAIYIDYGSLNISNCNSNSSVKASIYNNGTILSDVIITTLNGDIRNVSYGESIDLTGTVTACGMSVAAQELSFKVNGKEINAESDDYGIYSASFTVDFVGDRNVDATYKGSTGSETVNKGKLVSSKADVIVTVEDIKSKVGEKVKFIAKVKDVYSNPVQGGVVVFGVNGKEYKANVVNGIASVEIVLEKAGNYSATAFYKGDENHNDSYAAFTVEVINGSNPNPINKSGISMEHTGSPLIALLFALISLPLIRRK